MLGVALGWIHIQAGPVAYGCLVGSKNVFRRKLITISTSKVREIASNIVIRQNN